MYLKFLTTVHFIILIKLISPNCVSQNHVIFSKYIKFYPPFINYFSQNEYPVSLYRPAPKNVLQCG